MRVSSEWRAKSVVPFGMKNIIRHDKNVLHVLIETRITEEAMHTRERHIALIVELALILFRVRSTTLSRLHVQHLRTVMKSLRIVHWRTQQRSRSDNSISRQGWYWNNSHGCQMEIMNSQRWFNFSWIALTAQLCHPLHSFRSERDPCILTTTKHWACELYVLLQMKVCGRLLMTVVLMLNCGDNAEIKMILHPIWLHRKATFNGVGTSTTSEKLNMPMAMRLRESDMVIPGCVHSRENLEKTRLLLVIQACQAKLGMTKRVRDVWITLDDNDAQSLEVARQVGTGCSWLGSTIWNATTMRVIFYWMTLSLTLAMHLFLTMLLEIQAIRILPIASHMRSMFAVANFRGVCSRLANVERTSWSTQRHHEFLESHEESDTGADCEKFVHSFEDTLNMDDRLRKVWSRQQHEPEETLRSKSEIDELHHGTQELPWAAQSSVWRNFSILLKPKHCDHDLPEWTSSFCCKRWGVVEHVGSLQSTSTLRFFAALVWTGVLEEYVCGKAVGKQRTVDQSFPDTLRSRPRNFFLDFVFAIFDRQLGSVQRRFLYTLMGVCKQVMECWFGTGTSRMAASCWIWSLSFHANQLSWTLRWRRTHGWTRTMKLWWSVFG